MPGGEPPPAFDTSAGRVEQENPRRAPRAYLSHADAAGPFDRVQVSGVASRFVEGEEEHDRWVAASAPARVAPCPVTTRT
ncbi:hypothetical protein [Streptomyces sp. JHA26]|uniref:hypothetical protein n=1 Tax=Streptomyces sp. JHA26 TaxID=1917143 RepID=UPI001C0DF49F|nr:hypothetical protein [Streptomyces sp. JHA26]